MPKGFFLNNRRLIKIFLLAVAVVCQRTDFSSARTDLVKTDLATSLNELGQMSGRDKSALLSSIGMGSGGGIPWGNIVGRFLFGSIGLIAFIYGKKQQSMKPLVIGIALMAYPYFVQNTFWTYAIGVGLCGALYYYRD